MKRKEEKRKETYHLYLLSSKCVYQCIHVLCTNSVPAVLCTAQGTCKKAVGSLGKSVKPALKRRPICTALEAGGLPIWYASSEFTLGLCADHLPRLSYFIPFV